MPVRLGLLWAAGLGVTTNSNMYLTTVSDPLCAAVAAKQPVVWQYHVSDFVNGKATGWYDYDDAASVIVERLHDEWMYNRYEGGALCVDT